MLAELGWPEEQFRWSRDWHEEQERVKSGAAKYMDEPCMTVGGRDGVPLARAIAQYYYRLADGRLVCVRYRYEGIHKRIPKCLTFTPSHRGGWWEALPNSTAVPSEDRHGGGLPLYRLPELLEAIGGNDREIWIVADERCVDAVLALPDTDFSKDGKVPVTCLFGDYRGKPGQSDLAPLRDRRCFLIADTDSRDRNAVLATAKALAKLDCGIRLCRRHRRGRLPEHDRLDTECGHPVVPPRADGTSCRGVPRRSSGRTVDRRSRRPLHCRRCREAPEPVYPCLDPRERRRGGLGIPAGEAQAVPGPGDVRPEGSKTERTTPRAPVCADRRPRKP